MIETGMEFVRRERCMKINLSQISLINPAHPRGMSGGGIFAWPNGYELSDDWSKPKLVGIFHSYKESKGLLIGTSLIAVATAVMLGEMKGFDGVQ
jgi:hypothetical protein